MSASDEVTRYDDIHTVWSFDWFLYCNTAVSCTIKTSLCESCVTDSWTDRHEQMQTRFYLQRWTDRQTDMNKQTDMNRQT